MANGIFNLDIFNEAIFNTHVAVAVGGVNDQPSVVPMEVVKPWKEGVEQPTEFEFVVTFEPRIARSFHLVIDAWPYSQSIKKLVIKFWSFLMWSKDASLPSLVATPHQHKESEIAIFSGARYFKPTHVIGFQASPRHEGKFHKTLYGKAMYGAYIIRMAEHAWDS